MGISDGLNETDAALIGQAFVGPTDSTLLRPSRPLSTIDAVWTNKSMIGHPDPDMSATVPDAGGADVRGTHAALSGGPPNSHYLVAWMTTVEVTLQNYDLYPRPMAGAKLATRAHRVRGDHFEGCVDGKPASGCIDILAGGQMPTIAAVGSTIKDYSYTVVYEPAINGAYFLGELAKFVHVSPQRFDHVQVSGSGPCGLTVRVKGTVGQKVDLAAVDPKGTVHVTAASIPSSGFADVEL